MASKLRKRPQRSNKSAEVVDSTPSSAAVVRTGLLAVFDYVFIIALVFGGCCTNAWSLEILLKRGADFGSALTFTQMTFIATQGLFSFVTFRKDGHLTWIPHLKPAVIPRSTWLVQVILMFCMSLLNNWSFSYKVPLTVQIIVRSSGLAVSMFFGYFTMNKKYSFSQIIAVVVVTAGVILATMSGPSSSSGSNSQNSSDFRQYTIGISMLVLASIITGYYGTLQEQTYKRYGPHWREAVFYTHLFSLPMFFFLKSDIEHGFSSLSASGRDTFGGATHSLIYLALNLVTQFLCTSSVNKLSTMVSSVSTNLVLTARKALSLCISVWWFNNRWDGRLSIGASMVFFGTIMYTTSGNNTKEKDEHRGRSDSKTHVKSN